MPMHPKTLLLAATASLSFAPSGLKLSAAPYASAVKNEAGTVSFILNEAADLVSVKFEDATRTDLGPKAAGTHTFPLGAHTSFEIIVEKVAGPGWRDGVLQQISDDANPLVDLYNQKGLAINRNPASPYFGRVYSSVSATATTAKGRALSDGIYVLNADLSATALGQNALTGGITWDSSATATASPYRLSIGEDDKVYITDWSDSMGSVYVADPDINAATNILPGPFSLNAPIGEEAFHGSIAAAIATGTQAAGDLALFVVDEDLQDDRTTPTLTQVNSVWRWDAGSSLPIGEEMFPPQRLLTHQINFVSQLCDLAVDKQGYLYKSQRRTRGVEAGVTVIDRDGNLITNTKTEWINYNLALPEPTFTATVDTFMETGAIAISDDGWLASLIHATTTAEDSRIPLPANAIQLVKIITDEVTQLPQFDFTQHLIIPTGLNLTGANERGRSIAFDAAGNIYASNGASVAPGQGLLRVYAPGGHTIATTSSAGAFSIETLSPQPSGEAPVIGAVSLEGTTLSIAFSANEGIPESFAVEKSTALKEGEWSTETAAGISGSAPLFTATITISGAEQFYRIKRL